MKKLLFSFFALMLALGASAQQSVETRVKASIDMENIRVGKTLSDDQQAKMTVILTEHFTKVNDGAYPDSKALGQANLATSKKVEEVFTPEQFAKRKQYFADLAAKRAAQNK